MFVEERFIKAATYQRPDEIPVLASFLPAAFLRYSTALNAFAAEYPEIFDNYWINYNFERDCPARYRRGRYTDEWGCVWYNERDGFDGYVHGHPIQARGDIPGYEAPVLDNGDIPHGFLYLRILDLRGFEEAMVDFAEEPPELELLLDKVTDGVTRQTRWLAENTDARMHILGDDLGMQNGLAVGADKWRRYLKPRFTRIFKPLRDAGRFVYMHTDGQIFEIIPDLAEAGASMINPQFRANGLDRLRAVCKGKHPICLDLDRQAFPYATTAELRDHVEQTVTTLWLPEGGLGLNVEFGPEVPLENMRAVMDAIDRMRHYKG